jgi:DNA polymerase-3 subunit alpha
MDSARVLGYCYALGDRITKAFPQAVMGKDVPLSGIFDPGHPRYGEAKLRSARCLRPSQRSSRCLRPRGLEGLIRQAGCTRPG